MYVFSHSKSLKDCLDHQKKIEGNIYLQHIFLAYSNSCDLEYKMMGQNKFSLQKRGKTLQIDLPKMHSRGTYVAQSVNRLSVYLQLRSWSQGPGIDPHIQLPDQQGNCFSLSLCFLASPLTLWWWWWWRWWWWNNNDQHNYASAVPSMVKAAERIIISWNPSNDSVAWVQF